MKSRRRAAAVCAVALVTGTAVCQVRPDLGTVVHLVLLPFVTFLVCAYSAPMVRPVAAAGALVGGVVSVFGWTLPLSGASPVLLVTRGEGDPFGAEARRRREDLARRLRQVAPDVRVLRHPFGTGTSEAPTFFARYPSVKLVVSGPPGRLNVRLPADASSGAGRGRELGGEVAAPGLPPSVRCLRTDGSAAAVTLSDDGGNGTHEFIALLAAGLAADPRDPDQLDLRAAGSVDARWTAPNHRGYPWLVVGDRALAAALSSGGYSAGRLGCAASAYRLAASFVSPSDDPVLLRAILTNYGVALAVRAVYERDSPARRQAVRLWRRASELDTGSTDGPASGDAGPAAASNIALTRAASDGLLDDIDSGTPCDRLPSPGPRTTP